MYKLDIHKMPTGYYIELKDVKSGKYYFNDDIGKRLGVLYRGIALQNGGFIEVSAEDLEGNDIEEIWFGSYRDARKVKNMIEKCCRGI